ncbi:MAG TPA: hypothetical protein PK657_08675 [Legionella sp.]|nr:hypothetical protein [Legionella sp.]
MNRLMMIAATGFLALLLTACGDNSKPADTTVVVPATEDKTTVVVPADENKPADTQNQSN